MIARLALSPVLLTSLIAAPVAYQIAPSEAGSFSLEVYKTGLYSGKKHVFVFARYGGDLFYDPDTPERSRVEMTIEGGSIVCTDDWVNAKDLKKIQDTALEDMMDVRRHPRLSFVSERVLGKGEGTFEVPGMLTIRGIARPVVVEASLAPEADGTLWLAGTAIVKLKDYGIKPPSAALGLIGTKNEMTVTFRVKAAKNRNSEGESRP